MEWFSGLPLSTGPEQQSKAHQHQRGLRSEQAARVVRLAVADIGALAAFAREATLAVVGIQANGGSATGAVFPFWVVSVGSALSGGSVGQQQLGPAVAFVPGLSERRRADQRDDQAQQLCELPRTGLLCPKASLPIAWRRIGD